MRDGQVKGGLGGSPCIMLKGRDIGHLGVIECLPSEGQLL